MEVAKLLIGGHAGVNRPRHGGTTPLFTGARKGHMEVAKLLIEGHADVNLSVQNGRTPPAVAIAIVSVCRNC